jgi:hypothetical protein
MMVADGMGGHAGGATASRVAVETVSSVVASSQLAPDVTLRAALEAANRVVHDESQRNRSLAGMGTTGVAALFSADGVAFVANVGDSRAYRLRDATFEQITLDHSLVAEMRRRGLITEEEALVHPRRNEVLRSLGVEPDVVVDLHQLDLQPGDLFLCAPTVSRAWCAIRRSPTSCAASRRRRRCAHWSISRTAAAAPTTSRCRSRGFPGRSQAEARRRARDRQRVDARSPSRWSASLH